MWLGPAQNGNIPGAMKHFLAIRWELWFWVCGAFPPFHIAVHPGWSHDWSGAQSGRMPLKELARVRAMNGQRWKEMQAPKHFVHSLLHGRLPSRLYYSVKPHFGWRNSPRLWLHCYTHPELALFTLGRFTLGLSSGSSKSWVWNFLIFAPEQETILRPEQC